MNKRVVLTIAQLGLIVPVCASIALSGPFWPLAGLAMFFLFACVGVSVTYHRLLSHRAFKSPRWFVLVGSFLASVGFLLSPLEWAGQHEDHHRFVDTEGDPHAPRVRGNRVMLYCFHGDGKPGRAAARVILDPALGAMHRYFWPMLIGYIALCALVGGWRGIAFLWAMPCLLTLWAGIAGVFMHGKDGAKTGGWIAALVTCGEHRHARHHENPRDWAGDWPASWIIRMVAR